MLPTYRHSPRLFKGLNGIRSIIVFPLRPFDQAYCDVTRVQYRIWHCSCKTANDLKTGEMNAQESSLRNNPEVVTLYQRTASRTSRGAPAQARRLRNSYGRLLMRFAIRLHVLGLALASAGVATKAADISSDALGRKLYVGKCAKCHKLYDPAKYSDEQWQIWIDKMSRKAKLQPDQKKLISHYVEEALRGSPVKSVTEANVFGTTNPRTSATQGGTHDVLRRGIKP